MSEPRQTAVPPTPTPTLVPRQTAVPTTPTPTVTVTPEMREQLVQRVGEAAANSLDTLTPDELARMMTHYHITPTPTPTPDLSPAQLLLQQLDSASPANSGAAPAETRFEDAEESHMTPDGDVADASAEGEAVRIPFETLFITVSRNPNSQDSAGSPPSQMSGRSSR